MAPAAAGSGSLPSPTGACLARLPGEAKGALQPGHRRHPQKQKRRGEPPPFHAAKIAGAYQLTLVPIKNACVLAVLLPELVMPALIAAALVSLFTKSQPP